MRTTISAATTSAAETLSLRQGVRYVRSGVEPQLSDPTIDARFVDLNGANTDVLIQFTQSKFSAQTIRIVARLNWHPLHLIASDRTTFIPAGDRCLEGLDYRNVGVQPGGSPGMIRGYEYIQRRQRTKSIAATCTPSSRSR